MNNVNFKPMSYIHRLKAVHMDKKYLNNIDDPSVTRIVDPAYMGSAEFEFGTFGKTIGFMRACELKIISHIVTENGVDVKFWVIGSERGIERFKQNIQGHANSKAYTKEFTGIHTLFSRQPSNRVDAWLDVSGTVNSDKPDENEEPVFFTTQKKVAAGFFLELYRAKDFKLAKQVFDIHMFDSVYIPSNAYPGKVTGINEDGSYTVKIFHSAHQMSAYDIWPVSKFPINILNEAGMTFKEFRNEQ